VFTPNGDGVNEIWSIVLIDAAEVTLTVYNRWGLQVASKRVDFAGNGRLDLWDGNTANGSAVPEGVYVYRLEVRRNNQPEEIRTGSITLLR
jgi:gliding motility-associated-like protein